MKLVIITKAMDKDDPEAIKRSTAYQALARIGAIYKLEEGLKTLSTEDRLTERQASISPLVEEYFAWIKKVLFSVPPKSKTADGIRYSINQEEYLRVFLTDGEVAIDNSASERALRNFTIGRKNWVTINTPRGTEASTVIYSITQTAKSYLLFKKPIAFILLLISLTPLRPKLRILSNCSGVLFSISPNVFIPALRKQLYVLTENLASLI